MSPAVYALYVDLGVYRYVGATTRSLRDRLWVHRSCAVGWSNGSSSQEVYKWMWDVGARNVQIELLEEVHDLALLGERELAWITRLRTEGHELVNMVQMPHSSRRHPGGVRRQMSPESKEKNRLAHIGRKMTPETIANMRAAQKGHPVTDEMRMNMSKSAHRWRHVDKGISKPGCIWCDLVASA